MSAAPALTIEHLSKTYKGGHVALNDINIVVQQGDFFALLGPNGAGKTTLIGVLSSLVLKTHGKVCVLGHEIDRTPQEARALMGFVPQEFNFSIFKRVESIVIDQGGYYGLSKRIAKKNAEKYLKQLNLWDKRRANALELSGGMKRRLMIARALVHEPKLLMLDEPTAGVDIGIRRATWQFLRELNQQGTTIVLTTHYLEEAENLCRTIAIIDRGRLIRSCPMSDLFKQLHEQTVVLDVEEPIVEPLQLSDFEVKSIDQNILEVKIRSSHSLNQLFDQLAKLNITVKSMRNKSNRLESLFLKLTAEDEA